jgi:hypothetical protein
MYCLQQSKTFFCIESSKIIIFFHLQMSKNGACKYAQMPNDFCFGSKLPYYEHSTLTFFSRSPIPSYTDALIKASRQLRERSIPKTEQGSELPKSYHATSASRRRYASGSGKPPLPPSSSAASYSSSGARVVASDFYRGKVKSIYEREPLFHDFAVVSVRSNCQLLST